MTVTEPSFVKHMFPRLLVVSSYYTKFDGNPVNG